MSSNRSARWRAPGPAMACSAALVLTSPAAPPAVCHDSLPALDGALPGALVFNASSPAALSLSPSSTSSGESARCCCCLLALLTLLSVEGAPAALACTRSSDWHVRRSEPSRTSGRRCEGTNASARAMARTTALKAECRSRGRTPGPVLLRLLKLLPLLLLFADRARVPLFSPNEVITADVTAAPPLGGIAVRPQTDDALECSASKRAKEVRTPIRTKCCSV